MRKGFTSDVFTQAELRAPSGATRSQIETWCRSGILIPYKPGKGPGSRCLFKGAMPILDATEARELADAGYSNEKILQRFTLQRTLLTAFSPAQQVVERFRLYIQTMTMLADTFGRGPDYDSWLAKQQAQLRRMEKASARPDANSTSDERLLNLLDPVADMDAPHALAG